MIILKLIISCVNCGEDIVQTHGNLDNEPSVHLLLFEQS